MFSLLKKFTLDENVASIAFSHDGSAVMAATETGRVWQLNLRSTDNPATMVTVDSGGGKIGGLALISDPSVRFHDRCLARSTDLQLK
jgi:hypothetical protein